MNSYTTSGTRSWGDAWRTFRAARVALDLAPTLPFSYEQLHEVAMQVPEIDEMERAVRLLAQFCIAGGYDDPLAVLRALREVAEERKGGGPI